METAIDKLKENVQSSIKDTRKIIEDLNKNLLKASSFSPNWFSYFSIKVKVDNQLRILQELNDTLNH